MESPQKGLATVIEDTSSLASFKAAVQEALKRQPRGTKAKLAKKLNISKQYLNDIINMKSRTIPDSLKDRIANAMDTSVADLLMIGEYYIRTKVYFPYVQEVQRFAANSPERALFIFVKAQEEYHVKFPGITKDLVQYIDLPFLKSYMKGEFNDGELYSQCISLMKDILSYYLP